MSLSTNQKASLLYKKHLGVGETRYSREVFEEAYKSSFIVRPDQLWTFSDYIPCGDELSGGQAALNQIEFLQNGEVYSFFRSESDKEHNCVKRFVNLTLTKIDDGTDSSFLIADENGDPIKNIIPFNYYNEYYNYTLTFNGTEIPFGVGDWQVDIYSGILTFYGDVPEGIDHDNPPSLSFFQYVGGNGFRQDTYGYDGAILPIENILIDQNQTAITLTDNSNSNTSTVKKTLYQYIVNKANEIEDDFVSTYGWDANNHNEGIALSFEKIVPLTYSSTKDAVKGYDNSAESEIGTLLSNKIVESETASSNFKILFVSQKAANSEHTITIENNTVVGTTTSVAGLTNDVYKIFLDSEYKSFVVIKRLNDEIITDEKLTFTTKQSDDTITCLFLYWDYETAQYQPWINKEYTYVNFGFPVVTVNGKLPPTVQLGTSALSTFSDTITPDYYGPRTFTVTVASEVDSSNIKSADFTVKNTTDYYLNDIITSIKKQYTSNGINKFAGTIFLRSGTYEVNSDIDLSSFNDVIIYGEGEGTIIKSSSDELKQFIYNTSGTTLSFNNVKFENVRITAKSSTSNIFIANIYTNANIDIHTDNNKVYITNVSSTANISFFINNGNKTELSTHVTGSYFKCIIFNTHANYAFIKGCVINNVEMPNAEYIYLKDNVINTLSDKNENIFIDGNTISNYGERALEHKEQLPIMDKDAYYTGTENSTLYTNAKLPLYHEEDNKHIKFAELASPFSYNLEQNIIELIYDQDVLTIVDGILTTCITSDKVYLPSNKTTFERGKNSNLPDWNVIRDDGQKPTVTDAFIDLWKNKADLTEDGKVPLQQLPDSVAYGGLLCVGVWSFDDNNGKYPTYTDANKSESGDDEVNQLQKGWFWIVNPPKGYTDSTDSDDDNPVKNQIAEDGTIFTAGDWLVYIGSGDDDSLNKNNSWQKIDRAYSDPTYSILASEANLTGENHGWLWKDDKSEGGAIDLGNKTLIEALYEINKVLLKLEPKKPENIANIKIDLGEPEIVQYKTISNGIRNSETVIAYDLLKNKNIQVKTMSNNSELPIYKQLIYFGDSANVSFTLKVNNKEITSYTYKIESTDTKNFIWTDNNAIFIVSEPIETMTDADHGEGFWKGIYVYVFDKNKLDGKHEVTIALDNVTVEGIYSNRDYSYNGLITTNYNTLSPYINSSIGIDETVLSPSFADGALTFEYNSGIKMFRVNNNVKLENLSFRLDKVYKTGYVPAGRIMDIKAIINNDPKKIFCPQQSLDNAITYEVDNGYYDLKVEGYDVTFDSHILVKDSDTINFIATVYDFYGNTYDVNILNTKGYLFDNSELDDNRVTSDRLSNNSEYDATATFGFGAEYDNTKSVIDNNNLIKLEETNEDVIYSLYQYPTGTIYNIDYDSEYSGEIIDDEAYAVGCFKIGTLDNAAGFIFKINVPDYLKDKWSMNTLNGSTNNVVIQTCIVQDGTKITSWWNCNTPNNGFHIPDVNTFNDAVMYAGNSNTFIKRITFGRNIVYSGDVYVRIGIKKGTDMKFTNIELVEEI